ncbi:hypothetical protein JKA73_02415 [Myxococcus xanthus]|uniref:hypothetical protein n=1 Tax=Myxococcus xanthus TaxID=34 RepID=UPI00191724D1|nr:hypothetical protein [Myxococcus xanthus]QQR45020.1 hypothetical protein JKA73_02415 [Myxococcus xanthus]
MQQRELFYPGSSAYIWPHIKEVGWAQVPRNIGLILAITDSLRGKGQDVGRTYLDLLANNMGEGLVEVNNEQDFALRAGFSGGDRGVRSWEERLDALASLGFVKIHRGPSKRIDCILLVHPRKVVKELRRSGRFTNDALWDAFRQSLIDFDPENTDENEPLAPAADAQLQHPSPQMTVPPSSIVVGPVHVPVEQPRRRRRVGGT